MNKNEPSNTQTSNSSPRANLLQPNKPECLHVQKEIIHKNRQCCTEEPPSLFDKADEEDRVDVPFGILSGPLTIDH